MLKTCSTCAIEKPVDQFWRDAKKASGLCSACIDCMRTRAKNWRAKRPDYAAKYRKENREAARAAGKRWALAHPDQVREMEARRKPRDPEKKASYGRAYYAANRKRLIERQRERYQARGDEARDYARQWRKDNPEKRRAQRMAPRARIDSAMSRAIRASIESGAKAGRRWERLVGYTVTDLMKHLERQFQPGMTWANYGEWHIDHVVPKAAFNYERPEHIDFARCWALSNLQPLWAVDNMRKHARLDGEFQPSLAL